MRRTSAVQAELDAVRAERDALQQQLAAFASTQLTLLSALAASDDELVATVSAMDEERRCTGTLSRLLSVCQARLAELRATSSFPQPLA